MSATGSTRGDPPAAAARPRRRWLRRAVWTLAVLLVLFVLVGIGVQIVLWSGVPRRVVVSALQRATGMRVEVREVEIGWTGRAEARDVTFGLPLEDGPIAAAPVVKVRTAWLPVIALTGDAGLRSVRVERAAANVTADDAGSWNVQRLVATIRAARSKREGTKTTRLPDIEIVESTVTLTRGGRPPLTLPLVLDGKTLGGAWAFTADLGPVHAEGRVSPTGWAHRGTVRVSDAGAIAAVFMDDPPSPMSLEAAWTGDLLSGGLAGRAEIASAVVGGTGVSGKATIEVDRGVVSVSPERLTVTDARIPGGTAVLEGGTVRASAATISAKRLRVTAAGVGAQVAGLWDFEGESGEVTAGWTTGVAEGLEHSGTLTARASVPGVGERVIDLTLASRGRVGTRGWLGEATAHAAGPSWTSMAGRVTLGTLELTDGKGEPVVLSGLGLRLSETWPTVALTGLDLPGAAFTRATGELDVRTKRWTASLETEGWNVPRLKAGPVSALVRAEGDFASAEVKALRVAIGDAVVEGTGSYVPGRAEALVAEARGTARVPQLMRGKRARAEGDADAGAPGVQAVAPGAPGAALADAEQNRGTATGSVRVVGTLAPVALRADGGVRVEGVVVGQGVVEPLETGVHAELSDAGLTARIDPFTWLDGRWSLELGGDRRASDLELKASAEGVTLDRVAELLAPQLTIAGRLGVDATVRVPGLDVKRAEVDGSWTVTGASSGTLQAESGRGRFGVRGGRVRVDEMVLTAPGGAQVMGSVEFDGLESRRMRVDLQSRRWPVGLAAVPLAAAVSARLIADVDTVAWTADGPLLVHAEAYLKGTPLGVIEMKGGVEGRTLRAERLHAEVLGGTADGGMVVPLDDWTKVRAQLQLAGLDLSKLGEYAGAAGDVRGIVGGEIGVTEGLPEHGEAPLGPLKVTAELRVSEGFQRGMHFGDVKIEGYAGRDRVIVSVPEAQVAGGEAQLWSRLSWHGSEPFLHADVDFRNLKLEELARAAVPDYKDTPGLISGTLTLGGYLREPHRAFGSARVRLRQSELGELPVITGLYALLNVRGRSDDPQGRGQATLRLEGDRLEVMSFRYFNRGAEIVGSGALTNVWKGKKSPIVGIAAGDVAPLRGSWIPFASSLNRTLKAVTSNAVSVRIDGTPERVELTTTAFGDVETLVKRVLGEPEAAE